jgi:prepilin-type N-terminal cleavage/methylation domain-containing protein
MQSNRGFSLVELIIAVAIVAIGASIAVPQYSSYVQKTIVSTGFQYAIGPQVEIAEKVRSGGELPPNSQRFYENSSADAEISYVHWYSNKAHGGRIVINYGPGAGPRLKNKRLWFVLDASNPLRVKWTCMNYPKASRALPVDTLPKKCL